MEPVLQLKPAGARALVKGHPWVYAGAVARETGNPASGQAVRLLDPAGEFLAWAWYSPRSQIRARSLGPGPGPEAPPDQAWLAGRLARAVARRRGDWETPLAAVRLVNAEGDGLPGLVVDRYGPGLVVQALSAGAEARKAAVAAWLAEHLRPEWIYEKSEPQARKLEGLPPAQGPLWGPAPPARLAVEEADCRFLVDVAGGQKTGFFLDQRTNRQVVAAWAEGRTVLDCFAYSGGFAVRALLAGATRAVLVDSSAGALELAGENLAANRVGERAELVKANVFEYLRSLRDQGASFGLIVLDPPKLAPTRALAPKAARAYKDLNLLALKLLAPEGILASFSCSAGMDPAFFREVLGWAAQDAGAAVQVVARLGQPADHPVLLGLPESEYLKGFLLRRL